MRVIVKDTVCVFCASRLVLDGIRQTCEENCEFSQDLDWHPDTWSKLKPVIDYQRTLVEDSHK